MQMMEILLLAAGLAAFIASFFIPERKGSTDPKDLIDENALQEMIDEKIDDSRRRIDDMADETISYSMEKTERSLDKLTNEKLMAIGDYSNTVMGEINKSHEEVVFLSDMLGRNKDELTSLMQQADKISKEADNRPGIHAGDTVLVKTAGVLEDKGKIYIAVEDFVKLIPEK